MKKDLNTGNNIRQGDETIYYYLHTNGNLISKPVASGIEEEFEESDFVKAYWLLNLSERYDAYIMLIRATMMGANKYRIEELKKAWDITDDDTKLFADRIKLKVSETKVRFLIEVKEPKEHEESQLSGSGTTVFDAIVDFFHNALNRPEE